MKIRQIRYDGETTKIVYQLEKSGGEDKHTLESKELPKAVFVKAFAELTRVVGATTGIDVNPVQINLWHDDEGICSFRIVGTKRAFEPHHGLVEIKTPEINTDSIDYKDFALIEDIEREAREYINGNRAQLNLIFAGVDDDQDGVQLRFSA